MKPLRIAVVGAGHMGSRHARKLAALRERGEAVALSAVVDLELGRAQPLAVELGSRATRAAAEAFRDADAAIIAASTRAHHELASAALEAGLDVLVEKPITATPAEAEALLALAERRGRILQVGHLEWHNPVLRETRARIVAPRLIEASRLGPFPERGADVDVVRDLMIHDLDIVQQLLGEEPERIEALGIAVVTDQPDVASARLTFPSGCVANLTASRVSPTVVRRIRCFEPDASWSLDLLARTAVGVRRCSPPGVGPAEFAREELAFAEGDALLAQLEAFVACVGSRRPPALSGREGLRALRSAWRVLEAMPGFGDPA